MNTIRNNLEKNESFPMQIDFLLQTPSFERNRLSDWVVKGIKAPSR